MPAKIFKGSSVEYSIVPLNESSMSGFSILDHLKNNVYENVEGVIVGGKYYCLLDNYEEPRSHWSLKIVGDYETEEPWLFINKRPGDLYFPMSYIGRHLSYNVSEFDLWTSDECDGPIAVITEVDAS